MIRPVRTVLAALAGLMAMAASAAAHPHVWVSIKSQLIYAPDGAVVAVRHAWTFDDMFSTFAVQGLESKQKGVFTREELQPLAEVNVTSLKEYDYFNFAKTDGKNAQFTDPTDYYLEQGKDQLLTLHFTLPLKAPVKSKTLDLEVYDPSYFVDFSFDGKTKDTVVLKGAPAQCKAQVTSLRDTAGPPPTLQLGDPRLEVPLDPEKWGNTWGAQFANKISVRC